MIIIGEPNNIEKYIALDGEIALKVQQAGWKAKYIDDGGNLYFKRSDKLEKYLKSVSFDIEQKCLHP